MACADPTSLISHNVPAGAFHSPCHCPQMHSILNFLCSFSSRTLSSRSLTPTPCQPHTGWLLPVIQDAVQVSSFIHPFLNPSTLGRTDRLFLGHAETFFTISMTPKCIHLIVSCSPTLSLVPNTYQEPRKSYRQMTNTQQRLIVLVTDPTLDGHHISVCSRHHGFMVEVPSHTRHRADSAGSQSNHYFPPGFVLDPQCFDGKCLLLLNRK